MDRESLFKKIERIKISAQHLVSDILAGAYRSAFKGSGMEFEDVREYMDGDEVRSIDWNVTARLGHPYVKRFREERELTVMLLVDTSTSCRFGSAAAGSKNDIMAEIAAILAFSAIKNNDKVGLLLFSNVVERFLSPKKGEQHVLRVIRELLVQRASSPGTDIRASLAFLGKVQQRRSICFVISDFRCPDFAHELAIAAKRHEIIAIAITDPFELRFPNVDIATLQDLETGEIKVVDTSQTNRQQEMHSRELKRLADLKAIVERCGGSFLSIRTDHSYVLPIKLFMKKRKKL